MGTLLLLKLQKVNDFHVGDNKENLKTLLFSFKRILRAESVRFPNNRLPFHSMLQHGTRNLASSVYLTVK